MATVRFESASRFYPGHSAPAVDAIDLDIADGEFLVLVGPSGCGKTTTLRMLAGLEPVDEGRVFIGDRDVTRVPPKDRDVAMVFQNYALYPHMTVADNMGFALEMAKVPKAERKGMVATAAEMLDLLPFLDRKPRALSGGQRQRVAMGRAIVRRPQVFLMDELLSNLDAKLRVQTRTQIAQLQRELAVTTVYVTHDQTEAMTMGDRIVVMKDGLVQQIGTPEYLYDFPANAFVADFIGSPAMNLLPDKHGHVIGVRPEDLEIVEAGHGVEIVVDLVEVLGADAYLYGHAVSEEPRVDIVARVHGRQHPHAGDRVVVAPAHGRLHVFDEATGKRLEHPEDLYLPGSAHF